MIPIPGATALVVALVASGLPTDSSFAGFLPPRRQARRTRLKELRKIRSTLVLYEAPHRLPTRWWTLRRCWVIAGLHWLAS